MTKINYAQLSTHLKQKLAPVYIVSGDELWLKHEAILQLRTASCAAGFTERIRIVPEAGFAWESLYDVLYARSLLATKRVIELDFRTEHPNKIAASTLQEYAKAPVADNILLIDIAKIDSKLAKASWYQALEKIGIALPIWPLSPDQLPAWLMERAKKYKLTLRADAAHFLAEMVEGNLSAGAQAIEKIYLLKPTVALDIPLLKSILMDESCYTVFDLVEAITAGATAKSLHILHSLQANGTEPTLILWAITREIRIVAALLAAKQQGQSLEPLFQQHKIFARRKSTLQTFLTHITQEMCWQSLLRACDIDRMLKGAQPGNSWQGLALLSLTLSHAVSTPFAQH